MMFFKCSVFVVLAWSTSVFAQTTQPANAVEMRAYDISELIRVAQDYPGPKPTESEEERGGGDIFGTSNAGLSPQPRSVFRVSDVQADGLVVDSILQLVSNQIDPESWMVNGGTVGSLNAMGSVLIISQTAENHRKIDAMLKMLRDIAKPDLTFCVRAYWLSLTPEESVKMLGKGQALPSTSPIAPEELLDKQFIYSQAQTTCFNGQAVHVFSGRQQSVFVDANPVVGTDALGFDPEIELVLSGVQLQVRPRLTTDGKSAVVDVSSVIMEQSDLGRSAISEVVGSTSRPSLVEVDRQNRIRQQLQTSVRVPLGKKVLVGGMTIEPSKLNGQQLYLVLEVGEIKPE